MPPFRSWHVSNKIIAPFIAVAVIGLVAGFFALQDLVGTLLDHREQQQVTRAVEIVTHRLSMNENDLRLSAQLAGQAVGGRELLFKDLGPIQSNFGLTQIYLIDVHGGIKGGRGNLPNVLPDGSQPLIRDALRGKLGLANLGSPWGLSQWAAAPVMDESGITGAVLVGKTLDSSVLAEIKGGNDIELGTFFNGRLNNITAPILKNLDTALLSEERTADIIYPASAGDVPAKLMVKPLNILNGSGGYLVLKANPDVVLARYRVFMLIAGGAALLFMVLALTGWFIGHSITRPLSAMVQTARNFAAGQHAERVVLPNIPMMGRPDGSDELAELAAAMNNMAATIEEQFISLNESNQEIRRQMEQTGIMYSESILSLVTAVEAKDPYTRGHSEHVARYSTWIAEELGLPHEEVDLVTRAAQLHDIGKIGIVDAVLQKRDALDVSEKALIMKHPVIGFEIVRRSAILSPIAPLVKHHHEWFTGGGYPDGLCGDQIPLGARILAVADAFDAMTSTRPYRGPLPPDQAIEIIKTDRLGQFDPRAANAFIRVIERIPECQALIESRVFGPAQSGSLSNSDVITPAEQKEILASYQIVDQLRRERELGPLLRCLARIIKETFGYSRCMVAMVDEAGEKMVVLASAGYDRDPAGEYLALWKGITGWAALQGEPINIRDVRSDPRYIPMSATTNSQLAVPINVASLIIGVLTVESDSRNAFTLDDVQVLQKVVGLAGPAIEIVRSREYLRNRWFPKIVNKRYKINY